MQKAKTQVKYDNLVAQIVVLKKELYEVNNELTNKIAERNSIKTGLISGAQELKEVKDKCYKLNEESNIRQIELDSKESLLQERETNITNNELAFRKQMEVDEKIYNDKIKLYSNNLLDLQGKAELKKQEVIKEKENRKYYHNLVKDLKKENKELSKDKNRLDKNIHQLKKEIIDSLSSLDLQLSIKDNKLKEIQAQVLIEQQKIALPEKNIDILSKKLDRKKKNLDIIIRRFNKQFKEKFPLQELKL